MRKRPLSATAGSAGTEAGRVFLCQRVACSAAYARDRFHCAPALQDVTWILNGDDNERTRSPKPQNAEQLRDWLDHQREDLRWRVKRLRRHIRHAHADEDDPVPVLSLSTAVAKYGAALDRTRVRERIAALPEAMRPSPPETAGPQAELLVADWSRVLRPTQASIREPGGLTVGSRR